VYTHICVFVYISQRPLVRFSIVYPDGRQNICVYKYVHTQVCVCVCICLHACFARVYMCMSCRYMCLRAYFCADQGNMEWRRRTSEIVWISSDKQRERICSSSSFFLITLLVRFGNESLYEKVSGEISRVCMHGIRKEREGGREREQMRKRNVMLSACCYRVVRESCHKYE